MRNAEAMYRKPVGGAILCRAGNNDDGLDGKRMVARKGGGHNARHNVGGLATVTIDYQGGCRGVWIKQAMFFSRRKFYREFSQMRFFSCQALAFGSSRYFRLRGFSNQDN